MQVGSHLTHTSVRFGAFSASDVRRINRAREGRSEYANPLDEVFNEFLPEPAGVLSHLPEMDSVFADKLQKTMEKRYYRKIPRNMTGHYRHELVELTKRLGDAPFYVPDRIVFCIEAAYRNIRESEGQ